MISKLAITDSYKFSHYRQYKPGMTHISSYVEARGVEKGRNWNQTVVAGNNYLLKKFLCEPIVKSQVEIDRMARRVGAHGPSFNAEGFKYILENYKGFAPVHVQMIAEGTVVPLRTPILQIVNTDPKVPWITSYLETHILRSIWYPTTVATLSFHCKRHIRDAMLRTAGHTEGLEFKLHDFGARGVSSSESAAIGGLAHLYNFMGSDTFEAIELAEELFGEDMAGFSIDAAEHSTITSFGGPQYETEAFEHLLKEFGVENKIFAVVSDSYDIYDACSNKWGGVLKEKVEALAGINSKLVVRPDSGDPHIVPIDCMDKLGDRFGYTTNSKGFKVLPSYIGVIQGDGINEDSIKTILGNMEKRGWSAENITFGMGGELLQKVNRDTLKFAMKASAAKNINVNDGEWYDVFKDPVTDKGKVSKKGRLAVLRSGHFPNGYAVYHEDTYADIGVRNCLETVSYNGELKGKVDTLQKIRDRVNRSL